MSERTIDDRLKIVLNQAYDEEPTADEQEEFAFHFRDCKRDLECMVEALNHPEKFTDAEMTEAVNGMLLHAVGHLAQAARMYHGFIDPFGPTTPSSNTSNTP